MEVGPEELLGIGPLNQMYYPTILSGRLIDAFQP